MSDEKNESPKGSGRTRVAVIGTGLAGLATAYLLDHDKEKRFFLTLFEQAETLSLDSESVTLQNEKTGTRERIDLPPRSFCRGYYDNLCRMYEFLGIRFQPISLIWTFAEAVKATASGDANSKDTEITTKTYFVYGRGLHQSLLSPKLWLSGIRQILLAVYLTLCHVWFYTCCWLIEPRSPRQKAQSDSKLGSEDPGCENLRQYLQRIRLPERYIQKYLLPVMSIICTCTHDNLLDFPASDVVGSVRGSFRQKFYVSGDGVNRVQLKLSEGLQDVRLKARIVKVTPTDGRVVVSWQRTDDENEKVHDEVFDRVVLAISPNAAATIFDPAKPVLGQIPTASVVNTLLAPPGERYSVIREHGDIPAGQCTYRGGDTQNMAFRTKFSSDVVETDSLHYLPNGLTIKTSASSLGEPSMEVLVAAKFTRTLRTAESRNITNRIFDKSKSVGNSAWSHGKENVWVVGSWCWDGLVLLEGCVVSAMRVADDFGVDLPW